MTAGLDECLDDFHGDSDSCSRYSVRYNLNLVNFPCLSYCVTPGDLRNVIVSIYVSLCNELPR